MPRRGANAAWQQAVAHARSQPNDAIALWVCRGGHRYVVGGPPVEFCGMHLVCIKSPAYMTGRELVCSCGERPLNRITTDRGRVRAAKALLRIGGLEAVRDFFQQIAPPDGASSEVRIAGWIPCRDFHRSQSFQLMCELGHIPLSPHTELRRMSGTGWARHV